MSDDTIDRIKEITEVVSNVIEDNEDLIRKVSDMVDGGSGDERVYTITDRDVKKEVYEDEDGVELVMGPIKDDISDVGLEKLEDGIYVKFASEEIVIKDMGEDILIEDAEAKLNNGVLTVEVPKVQEEPDNGGD